MTRNEAIIAGLVATLNSGLGACRFAGVLRNRDCHPGTTAQD